MFKFLSYTGEQGRGALIYDAACWMSILQITAKHSHYVPISLAIISVARAVETTP